MVDGKRPYLKKLDTNKNNEKILSFKNKYKGERCYIIGNGPNLNQTDLTLLKDEITFGMNKIYLNVDKMGYMPTYLVVVNPLVIDQCAKELLQISAPKFVGHEGLKYLPIRDDIIYIMSFSQKHYFSKTLLNNIWQGGTVTYCAMQVAYHMGFDEVVLVGVDHNYTFNGNPNQEVVSEGDDINHFHSGYFGRGMKWQLPDLEMSEKAYSLAKIAFEKKGGRIIDATVGGKLRIFDRITYNEIFNM